MDTISYSKTTFTDTDISPDIDATYLNKNETGHTTEVSKINELVGHVNNDAVTEIRNTAAWFTANNPVLGVRQIGVETDTGKIKIGDGTMAWNSLAYNIKPPSTIPATDHTMEWPDCYYYAKSNLSSGNHVRSIDGRSTTLAPNQYNFGITNEFLTGAQIGGVPDASSYCFVMTIRLWTDDSAGVSQRLMFSGGGHLYVERGSGSSWSGTKTLIA